MRRSPRGATRKKVKSRCVSMALLSLARGWPTLLSARPAHRSLGVTAADVGTPWLPLPTAGDTMALGAALAERARAGDTLLLHGGYGAGKTCLARGFIRRWLGDEDASLHVASPSYLIDNTYPDEEGGALQPGGRH